jgi:hypothetical protein
MPIEAIEVVEAHTYFVGSSGALAHNANGFCERLAQE